MSTQDIVTEVCIVGSGAAGITAAWFLNKAGIKVTLIEGSHDLGTWPAPNNPVPGKFYEDKLLLYNGESTGMFTTNYANKGNFLVLPTEEHGSPSERERYYGGTTNHWGGQTRPLDPVTFEGVPGYPAWPVTSSELAPFYSKAANLIRLAGDDFTATYWADKLGDDVPDMPNFETAMYQFLSGGNPTYLQFEKNKFIAETETFGSQGQTLEESSIEVVRNASLLHLDHHNGQVTRLVVGTMSDDDPPTNAGEFNIVADVYVLACGAIANARQLLLSNAANSSGLVGRYFMGHPTTGNAVRISGSFLTGAQFNLMKGRYANGGQYRSDQGVTVQGRFSPNAAVLRKLGIGSCWFRADTSSYYFEQAPNYNSYVTLADTTDKVFGQRQAQANWEFCELDKKTYRLTTKLFEEDVRYNNEKNHGTAKVTFASWETIHTQAVLNGHHLGTTRMSDDPTAGVVDKNLRTHDLENLYVAGSSVWPSGGVSNPTLSIIMFSIRLADHLSAVLRAPVS